MYDLINADEYITSFMKKDWINFAELRQQLNLETVTASYNVTLSQKGNSQQYVGVCPLPSHKDAKEKTFSANFEKGVWQCFGCKESGNVIDFAVLMEGRDKKDGKAVREVAKMLRDRFVTAANPNPAVAQPKPASAQIERTQPSEERRVVVNQPLDFELKTLDTEHPYFAASHLSKETVDHFGLGFCKRGLLAGRIAVPLVDDAAELVGYAGLALTQSETTRDNPRYLFPAPREHEDATYTFDASKFLYNGFRIGKAVKDLVVVRDCHTVWSLWQGGFANVVALMGNECSEDQANILTFLTADKARIWMLTDMSVESHACAESLLPKVAASRMCRWIKVSKEEEMAPEHPLLAVLPRR